MINIRYTDIQNELLKKIDKYIKLIMIDEESVWFKEL